MADRYACGLAGNARHSLLGESSLTLCVQHSERRMVIAALILWQLCCIIHIYINIYVYTPGTYL